MRDKVSCHILFLPAGLLLLAGGSWGIANYFRLRGPSDQELHELALRDVSKVTEEPEIPGSTRIDNIWLETTNNVRIRYRNRFPLSSEVRRQDTNLSLLLDSSNKIWAVKSAVGTVLSRRYFEEYNIEAKTVGKFCGPFLAVLGAILLFVFLGVQRSWKTWPAEERAKLEVDAQNLRLALVLFGNLVVFAILAHWLLNYLPGFAVTLLYLLSGGVLMRHLSKKKRPPVS
jgi:hypothetical protein